MNNILLSTMTKMIERDYHFELLNDDAAISNGNLESFDDNDKLQTIFRLVLNNEPESNSEIVSKALDYDKYFSECLSNVFKI